MSMLISEFEEGKLNIDEVRIIDEVLRNTDKKLKETIGAYIERFIIVVKKNIKVKGTRWDDIVRKFEWTFEHQECLKYISQLSISDKNRRDIEAALEKHEGKLDL